MPPEDEVPLAEEQPLPATLSSTADLLGYVPESDPEEDPEEDDDEDPKEDPADYPTDGGDDSDDEDESSDDEEDDDVDIEGDEEEEEHPDPADSTAVGLLAVDHASSAEETEPFETDESAAIPSSPPTYRVTARISIRDDPPTPVWSDTEVARLLAIPTPPPSPLSLWSPPLPQIPLPPLLVSPPPPASPTYPLGYIVAMIRLRAEAPSTSHSPPPHIILSYTRADTPPSRTPPLLPILLPTSSPSLLLPSTDHGEDRPEVCLPPRKRLCFAFGPGYEVGESSSTAAARLTGGFRADYGFVTTMDREIRRNLERDLGRWMTEFATRVRQDTDKIYVRLDDEQTERQPMVGRLNMLYRDRRAYARTALLMERDARMSREAWGRSMDASDLARSEVMSLRTTILGQQAVITELQATDRRRQTQMTEFQRQQGPAKGPAQSDAPEEAGSSSYIMLWLEMIDQNITAALAARDADRNTNDDDSHNSGTGVRRTERTARECTYTDFLKCQPLNFKGTEGVSGLSQWFERIKSVFHINNCTDENQVKFTTFTLYSVALTWWNTHVKTVGHDAAYGMPWKTLMKIMTDKYCPRNEIKKLEMEIWDMKVKCTDLISYTQRFQELALLCGRMFPEESDKIEKHVGGLPDTIHGSVVASKPKTMQEAVEITTELMDKKIRTFADCQTENKRKQDNNQQQQQQPQNKKQNTGMAYATGTGEKKLYGGSKPLCPKCSYHHDGQKPTCYECGAQGHFKRECPKLKNNKNRGNPDGNVNAPAKVYAVCHAGTNPDSNVVTGTFLLNNRYASILFDTGADRSFVSTAFM
ncbi:reverse transcriptase domain-containing protein [Tanacetum coccineum]